MTRSPRVRSTRRPDETLAVAPPLPRKPHPGRTTALAVALALGLALAGPALSADLYVDTGGTNSGNCQNPVSPCLTIQYALGQAAPSDTINVAAGTYAETVDVNKQGVSVLGAGVGSSIINVVGKATNSSGIYVQAADATLRGFTVQSNGGSVPRYGVKVAAVDGVTLDQLLVENIYRTGVDVLGSTNIAISSIESRNNAGAGLFLTDVKGAALSNLTTSGNAWSAMTVATWGRYTVLGTNGIVISGTNNFGEVATDNGGLQLEEGNYNDPLNPQPITWSNAIGDGADVTIQAADFAYALGGPQDDGQPRLRFYTTLAQAQSAVAGAPGHFLSNNRYIQDADDFTSPTAFYVYDVPGDTMTIQAAVDASGPGDTINVFAGTYADPVDIDGRAGLTITGEDKTTVIVQPTSTLCFNVASYGCSRRTAFRVVNSTDVLLQNLTMDFDLVKANFLFGSFFWDSTGALINNIVENLSIDDVSGGYYEFGLYFRATGYSDVARASLTVVGNTFINAGRVAVLVHDYSDATISGNTFTKTIADFGYAIELGSQSIGEISGNTISGYNTPALSDGSESAGIYVENAFTGRLFGIISGITKTVLVEGNEISDSQFGMWIGNGYDGYAGDVDITVTLNGNNFHDNIAGAAWIQDEDQEDGSSVTVTGGGNTLTNNGTYGYYVYSEGDGDLTVNLSGETITGQDTGLGVRDAGGGPDNSSYDVTIQASTISANTASGVDVGAPSGTGVMAVTLACNRFTGNAVAIQSASSGVTATSNAIDGNTVGVDGSGIAAGSMDATGNWWGAVDGPSDAGGSTASGSGDSVTANITFSPFAIAVPPCVSCASNAECDDGLACTGAETCNLGTSMCEPGTPVICAGQCLTGVCLEPSGTCQPVANGTTCDTGADVCSQPDACQNGACANTGGGGDPDNDDICSDDDNCPNNYNADQADADQDNIGDVCDGDTTPTSLVLSLVRLRLDDSERRDKGSARIKALLNDNDTAGGLSTALLANQVTVTVTDASITGFDATISVTGCREVGGRGKIICKSTDGKTRAVFSPTRQGPFIYNMRIGTGTLSDVETGSTQSTGEVTVTLQQGSVLRSDTIGACEQRGLTRLTCIERQPF